MKNEVLQQLWDRKSVRAYEDREISAEDKQLILAAALQAPTAGNQTLYTILDITDQALKDRLSVTCDNQPFIAKAPMVLVFCADVKRWYDVFCQVSDQVRKPAAGDLFLAQQDALIAAQNAVVAAQSLGIGSCYIGDILENYETHREMLQLPRYVVPACMAVFGYPNLQQQARPKPPRFPVEAIVCENGYDGEKAARMGTLLAQREVRKTDTLEGWVQRFCSRKWNSDFSREMSRSCAALYADWCGKELPEEDTV